MPHPHQAEPRVTISLPEAAPVDWRASAGGRSIIVVARFWFDARADAARVLGVSEAEVSLHKLPPRTGIGDTWDVATDPLKRRNALRRGGQRLRYEAWLRTFQKRL